jgi:pyruvate,water dikinase
MRYIRTFNAIDRGDLDAVGGKGLSLGLLTQAGLPVPPGYCVLTGAYRDAARADGLPALFSPLREEVLAAYDQLGSGLVAVRSSATGEDGEAASFAGQQETLLGVNGTEQLLDAIVRCWQSLHSDRARAYREKQDLADDQVVMAVVVQRLVEAEVSGVLFTRDPLDPTGQQMLVEAAWGLGEGVVSGRVMPDRFHVDRDSGRVRKEEISTKQVQMTLAGPQTLSAAKQQESCLGTKQLRELYDLGRRIEEYYGSPRDVEWALADGRLWILQARPITTAGAFEREEFRRRAIAELQAKAEPRGTVWAKYNLAEILPTPTPMTWAIVRRFMSGRGGYGLMLRDLGFDPDPALDDEGFIDLVCGRPYVNLSREPKLYFRDFPSGHSFQKLKESPDKAFYPQPMPDSERVSARFLLRVPMIFYRMLRNASRLRRLSESCANDLPKQVFPRFKALLGAARQEDLTTASPADLLKHLQRWTELTLSEFARQSLRPSVLAAVAMGNLEQALKKSIGPEAAAGLVRAALTGVHPEPDADLPAALAKLADGQVTQDEFLRDFGHRGPQEMELSRPRWNEAPELLQKPGTQPPARKQQFVEEDFFRQFVEEAKLPATRAEALRADFRKARLYSALRETSKHFLMMGYALIRRVLVELDRRHHLRGGVFFLTPDELPRLVTGEKLDDLVAERRQAHSLALSLDVPAVLFSDNLDAIGRPVLVSGATDMNGTPLSHGVAEGPALVLEDPQAADAAAYGYILVCPSTDPAWVPLFLRAKGLVMETGGVLSHGAIVAREFGLPAVAGIPNVQRRLRTGQRIRVDGNSGRVQVI